MARTRMVFCGIGVVALAAGAGPLATAGGETAAPAQSAAVAAGRCRSQQLRVTLAQASPGASHHGYVLRFRDQGGACTLTGYPGVDGLSAKGKRVLSARRTKSGYLGGLKPGRPIPQVHLANGKSASAILEWVDGPIPGQFCPRVQSLKVTPPNVLSSVRFSPKSLKPERLCDLQIHPVVSGTTGQEG
jgi:Domain of unknown function (DUF4232)